MICQAPTNCSASLVTGVPAFLSNESKPNKLSLKNGSQVRTHYPHLHVSPEFFIRLEFSFIKEVEKVFVARGDKGRVLRVLTVINERNSGAREKIYPMELSVMDEFPSLRFDFHVLSRMNRNLSDVISPKGTLVFSR